MKRMVSFAAILGLIVTACYTGPEEKSVESEWPEGKLFIIGGGKRPSHMIDSLIKESGVDREGTIVILPMSSSEPDTSAFYASKQFSDKGVESIVVYNIPDGNQATKSQLDSVTEASMIYITGGDQRRFMEAVLNTPLYDAMHAAYKSGSTIAGTSAGAAVMSKLMITGDEFKHPEYTGDFRTIESENLELIEGMGFLDKVIVDQHFIWRMRMNRLITAVIENPGHTGIGINESTALLVKNGQGIVIGDYQVMVIKNTCDSVRSQNGLLGARDMELEVLLPGDTLYLN